MKKKEKLFSKTGAKRVATGAVIGIMALTTLVGCTKTSALASENTDFYQADEYFEEILPVEVRKIVVEASSSLSWNQIIYNEKYLITLDKFGKSGPYKDVYKEFGFDSESLADKIEELLK